jgi:hypothetical protein
MSKQSKACGGTPSASLGRMVAFCAYSMSCNASTDCQPFLGGTARCCTRHTHHWCISSHWCIPTPSHLHLLSGDLQSSTATAILFLVCTISVHWWLLCCPGKERACAVQLDDTIQVCVVFTGDNTDLHTPVSVRTGRQGWMGTE